MARTKKKRGRHEKFYVFYDKNDFVECCGTAKQLVEDGRFKYTNACAEKAYSIKVGRAKGNVVVLG